MPLDPCTIERVTYGFRRVISEQVGVMQRIKSQQSRPLHSSFRATIREKLSLQEEGVAIERVESPIC